MRKSFSVLAVSLCVVFTVVGTTLLCFWELSTAEAAAAATAAQQRKFFVSSDS